MALSKWRSFMDTFGPGEGAYATAALLIALARKLIDKEIISKEEMSGIVDEAGGLLSRAPAGVMVRRALISFLSLGSTLGSKINRADMPPNFILTRRQPPPPP